MRDAEECRRRELCLDRPLDLGVGLDVDTASCLVLQTERSGSAPYRGDTSGVTHEDDDPAVLDQRAAQSQQLLLSGTVVCACHRQIRKP